MSIEDKLTLTRQRVEIIDHLARNLPPEKRVELQGELSIINAKIKALNTTEAARAKAAADKRRIASLTQAKSDMARARANAGLPTDDEDDDPAQTKAIDAWIDDVLRDGGITVIRAPSDGKRGIEIPASVPKALTRAIHKLCEGIHAAARGHELPPLWNGLCLANRHGLDFEGQPCDLCAKAATTGARSDVARTTPAKRKRG